MASIFEATAGKLIGPTTGGTVTQATGKSTGVTLNAASGQITMDDAALAAAAEISFTVTNSEFSFYRRCDRKPWFWRHCWQLRSSGKHHC